MLFTEAQQAVTSAAIVDIVDARGLRGTTTMTTGAESALLPWQSFLVCTGKKQFNPACENRSDPDGGDT